MPEDALSEETIARVLLDCNTGAKTSAAQN